MAKFKIFAVLEVQYEKEIEADSLEDALDIANNTPPNKMKVKRSKYHPFRVYDVKKISNNGAECHQCGNKHLELLDNGMTACFKCDTSW